MHMLPQVIQVLLNFDNESDAEFHKVISQLLVLDDLTKDSSGTLQTRTIMITAFKQRVDLPESYLMSTPGLPTDKDDNQGINDTTEMHA